MGVLRIRAVLLGVKNLGPLMLASSHVIYCRTIGNSWGFGTAEQVMQG